LFKINFFIAEDGWNLSDRNFQNGFWDKPPNDLVTLEAQLYIVKK